MCTGRGRCLIFAMQMASDYLPRLARAARHNGTFRKLDPVSSRSVGGARRASRRSVVLCGLSCRHRRCSSAPLARV